MTPPGIGRLRTKSSTTFTPKYPSRGAPIRARAAAVGNRHSPPLCAGSRHDCSALYRQAGASRQIFDPRCASGRGSKVEEGTVRARKNLTAWKRGEPGATEGRVRSGSPRLPSRVRRHAAILMQPKKERWTPRQGRLLACGRCSEIMLVFPANGIGRRQSNDFYRAAALKRSSAVR